MVGALVLTLVVAAPVQEVTSPPVGSPVRKAVLDALRVSTKRSLKGKRVVFKVDHMKQQGNWVFFTGKGLNPDGSELDYRGTAFQEAKDADMFADWVCALFQKRKGKWKVERWVWGATDVTWIGWWKETGAPRAIFPPLDEGSG